ncbi:MAG: thiol-disulfide oxidoreductase DCC family protein, partial [Pontibacterium sp.]
IVFYDGACPLCRKEIDHYRKIDKARCISWVDVTSCPEQLTPFGISYPAAMQRLHCVDTNGNKAIGVQGFLLIWDNLRYYKHVANTVRFLRLTRVLSFAYNRFAVWRYKKRCTEHCSLK